MLYSSMYSSYSSLLLALVATVDKYKYKQCTVRMIVYEANSTVRTGQKSLHPKSSPSQENYLQPQGKKKQANKQTNHSKKTMKMTDKSQTPPPESKRGHRAVVSAIILALGCTMTALFFVREGSFLRTVTASASTSYSRSTETISRDLVQKKSTLRTELQESVGAHFQSLRQNHTEEMETQRLQFRHEMEAMKAELELRLQALEEIANKDTPTDSDPQTAAENDTEEKMEDDHQKKEQLPGLPPLRVCRTDAVPLPGAKKPLHVKYQCDDQLYKNFTKQLLIPYIENITLHGTDWGRRPTALPRNKSILIMGNSHTRQTLLELICQYSDSIQKFESPNERLLNIRFQNDATLLLLYNHPVEAAINFTESFQEATGRHIESFDAFVIGTFNQAIKKIENTNFYKEMMNWTKADPTKLAFGKVEPPNAISASRFYSGPIVQTSSYDINRDSDFQALVEAMDEVILQDNQRRSSENFRAISSRRHIPALDGHECGTEGNTRKCVRQWAASHRCVGAEGGHPTLIAHDIQEALFSMVK